ncbi:hypothetical protein BH23PSE1_BH23PSE1_04620 [soil metagenome]
MQQGDTDSGMAGAPQATASGRITRRAALGITAGFALSGCAAGISPPPEIAATRRATQLVVAKSSRSLTLMQGHQTLARYRVHLGFAPEGHKTGSGDGRTPEGRYVIDRRNPRSAFFLSLGISYPSVEDLARAQALGQRAGENIMIHGEPSRGGRRRPGEDWTAGCIAVSDAEMEEVWAMVPTGVPITILA